MSRRGGLLGLNGERWMPIHARVPARRRRPGREANERYLAERRAFVAEHGIVYSVMSMTVDHEFFLEPAFYWKDEMTPLQASSFGEEIDPRGVINPGSLSLAR